MPEDIHEDRPGGVFIPFDKLLSQMDGKLDKIREEIHVIHESKLDQAVFDAFQKSYEDRHERLRTQFLEYKSDTDKAIELLQRYKAEREAVQAQNRYYLGGGLLVGILVIMNLAINASQLFGGP